MAASRKQNGDRDSNDGDLRLSPGTENYLLCLYKLWEDDEIPTITQLTDTLRQLPDTEGLGTIGAFRCWYGPPNAETEFSRRWYGQTD